MKVLVMGGTQFNGLALVLELVRTGHDVSVLNRGRSQAKLPRSVRRLTADRREPDSVRAAIGDEEFDCVQDISAYRVEDVELMSDIFRSRTGHYIFASSTVIYAASNSLPITEEHPLDRSEQQNEYGLQKLLCEDHLVRAHREWGFPASIAAFSMVFGPRNIIPDREQRMFVRLLHRRRVMIPGDGTTVGQVGHVDDQARALRMMMGQSQTFGRRYNLTGGDCYTDEGYVDTLAAVAGVEVEKVFVPGDVMEGLYSGEVVLGGLATPVRADTRGTRREDRSIRLFQIGRILQRIAPHLHHWNRSVFFSTARLQDDVGWRPEYTFEAAAQHTFEWMQREGLDKSLDFDFSFEDSLLERIAPS